MKIVDYSIVNVDDMPKALVEGWQPYGSPFTLKTGSMADGCTLTIYQAVVKYEQAHGARITIHEKDGDQLPPRPAPNPTPTRAGI